MKKFIVVLSVLGLSCTAHANDQMQVGVGGNYRAPQYDVIMNDKTFRLLGRDHLRERQAMSAQKSIPVSNVSNVSNVSPALSIVNERYIPQSMRINAPQPLVDQQQSGMQSLPMPAAPAKLEPSAAPTRMQQEPIIAPTPVTSMPMDVANTMAAEDNVSAAPPLSTSSVDGWRARSGENVKTILTRWAERTGQPVPSVPQDYLVLTSDFSFFGTYDRAVERLMEKLSTSSAPMRQQPVRIQQPAPVPTVATYVQPDTMPQPQMQSPSGRWFALNGSPVHEVLKSWGEQAGVAIVWQASPDFAVKSTLSQNSSFEDAVAQLLGQYDLEMLRPRGQLYRNPANGQRVLVIREEKGGA